MKNYFITGSRAYGVAKADSDLDIVLYKDDAEQLSTFLKRIGIKIDSTNEVYSSYYFKIDNYPKINIVVVRNKDEFKEWKYATKKMMKIDSIKNRFERIRIFEQFRKEFREKF